MKYEVLETPQDNYKGSADNQHAPGTIEPCTFFLHDNGNAQPGIFHLLECGHVVIIDGEDTRCGRNCQEALDFAQSSTLPPTGDLLSLTRVHRPDSLYCEVCQGIPWDSYRRMQPPSDDLSRSAKPMLRRCLALTRGEIVAAIQVPDIGFEILLASPFPNQLYEAHNLSCGHRVWCAFSRNCARNCSHDRPCRVDDIRSLLKKQADVIFCEECVFRAERVHTRWETAAVGKSLGLTCDHRQYC